MPNVTQLIRNVRQSRRVQQSIIEKDYALSYLLAAIATTDELGENLVLKGGTALKKLYFSKYRFSEDLDYSTRVIGPIQQIDALMNDVVHGMVESLNQRGPFQISIEPLVLKLPHPGDQIAYIVRVQFPEHRQPLCRLKIEITIDEPILTPTENRHVLHGFAEDFYAQVAVYSLVEITAEKLRALLQSKSRLHERGWGASRVCRDYFDLWNLLQLPGIISPNLVPLLRDKCAVRSISFDTPYDFISEDLLSVARSEWKQQLLPFVPDAPSAAELLPQVQNLILSVWQQR
jgi:predicted nucleotidyltransferase component of viral defense system